MKNLWDMHCHIVPHVDDGSHNMETSLNMLRKDYKESITNVIITPHFRRDMFETSRDIVMHNFKALCTEALKEMPDFNLYLGYEYHVEPGMIHALEKDGRYRMNETRYVLVEFSEADSEKLIQDICASILNAGMYPIIAPCGTLCSHA